MNALTAGAFGVAGALAAIPVTAIAYAVPAHGSIRVPQRWWCGSPARPTTVLSLAALAGTASGVVTARLPWSLVAPALWLFAILGIGLAVVDIRRHRLPHAMTGIMWFVCVLGLGAESIASRHINDLVMGAAAGASVVTSAFLLAFSLPGQLGLGDVSFLGVIALSLGAFSPTTAAYGISLGIVAQACFAAANALCGRKRLGRRSLPFGPALFVGWFVAIAMSSR